MNVIMFIVGFIIFFLYIIGLLYMINRGHTEQKKDFLNDPEIPKTFKDSML